jgi:tetratricopeptide (TPR) repeat protein
MLKEIQEKVKECVIYDNLDQAFEELRYHMHYTKHDVNFHKLWGRLNHNQREYDQGNLTNEEFTVNKNRIRQSFLKIVEDIFSISTPEYHLATSFLKLGAVAIEEFRFEDALTHFNDVLVIFPGHIEASFKKGVALLATARFSEALVEFTIALEKNPYNHFALFNRGVAFFQLENEKKACEDWKKLKEMGFKKVNPLLIKYCE